jgi:hypothetical protein
VGSLNQCFFGVLSQAFRPSVLGVLGLRPAQRVSRVFYPRTCFEPVLTGSGDLTTLSLTQNFRSEKKHNPTVI